MSSVFAFRIPSTRAYAFAWSPENYPASLAVDNTRAKQAKKPPGEKEGCCQYT